MKKPITFYANPSWQNRQAQVGTPTAKQFVGVSRIVSKQSAKKDKVAIRYAQSHGVKFALAPEDGYRSAGHCNRFSGKVETTRQFV